MTSAANPAPEPGAENLRIPSLVEGLTSADDWYKKRRPQVLALWTQILGKLEPAPQDRRWFGDIRHAKILDRQEKPTYSRLHLELPIEKDLWQPHLLLLPKNQGPGPFPAVICWTETGPDYTAPEQWWGEWLASNGYVVLTGWSFIDKYRDGTKGRTGAPEKVYERFGHWLPVAKMAYDARREAEYLRSLGQVDARRIGSIGFSQGAKAAVYVAAFAPEIAVTVAVDPHIAVNGSTNWYDHWYMDWLRKFPDIRTQEHTVLSLLNPDRTRPGFEHDHHEVLALAAPRPFLLIGGSQSEDNGHNSDDLQSWGYFNRAREVYRLLGVPERIQFVSTADGHKPNGPHVDPAWKNFSSGGSRSSGLMSLAEIGAVFLTDARARLPATSSTRPAPTSSTCPCGTCCRSSASSAVSVSAGEMKRNVWLRTLTSRDGLLDLRHVAGDAFAAGAARLVMRVLLRWSAACGPFGEFGPWHSRQMHVRRLAADRRCSPCRAHRGN